MRQTAAIVIIGNEILSGKVRDSNSHFIATQLYEWGVSLERVHVIPDEVEVIADTVRQTSAAFDWVLTSGGVGPTHDDMTIEGIARAFGVEVVVHPELEEAIRGYFGDGTNAAHLKMATIPEGGELVLARERAFPALRYRNVLIFPGIPQILETKLKYVEDLLKGNPFVLRRMYLMCAEEDVAATLAEVEQANPGIEIGSYPRLNEPDYRVMLTIEGSDQAVVESALDALRSRIPTNYQVREE